MVGHCMFHPCHPHMGWDGTKAPVYGPVSSRLLFRQSVLLFFFFAASCRASTKTVWHLRLPFFHLLAACAYVHYHFLLKFIIIIIILLGSPFPSLLRPRFGAGHLGSCSAALTVVELGRLLELVPYYTTAVCSLMAFHL